MGENLENWEFRLVRAVNWEFDQKKFENWESAPPCPPPECTFTHNNDGECNEKKLEKFIT